jgi:hypothetical protein
VTKVYVDRAWKSSANPDDDVAILQVSQPGSSVPIEDVTGADRLATSAPATRTLVQVSDEDIEVIVAAATTRPERRPGPGRQTGQARSPRCHGLLNHARA